MVKRNETQKLKKSPDPRKINADPKNSRPELPHGLTESIELIILFIIGPITEIVQHLAEQSEFIAIMFLLI